MGSKIPPDWPEILDDKWYRIFVDRHVDIPPVVVTCASPYVDSHGCCYLGAVHKAKYAAGHECNWEFSWCTPPGLHNTCEKITNIAGPYDTELECTGG